MTAFGTGRFNPGFSKIIKLACCFAAMLANGVQAADSNQSDFNCAALRDVSITDTNPLSATAVRFSDTERPKIETADGKIDIPDYCRVRAAIRPQINFEMRLPLDDWNGKFYMAGCGGFCGEVLADKPGYSNAINVALVRGYAAVTTDAGHWAPHAADGVWAYNNRSAELDYSYRVIPEVSRVARVIIEKFYGAPERYSYFSGCSNGGRMGALTTQRYPDLFDGVLIGAPALDWRTLAMYSSWLYKANTDENGERIFDYRKTQLVSDAVMAHCDSSDGLRDGQITDPRLCNFDTETLRCPDGASGVDCLTKTEIDIVNKWYGGLPDTHGPDWSYRVPLGSEAYWPAWLTPPPGHAGGIYLFGDALHKYLVYEQDPGPTYSPVDLDLTRYPTELDYMRQFYRADNPDLTAFRDSGGKVIFYQGWADPAAIPGATIGYYEDLMERTGGRAKTKKFARLFMIPGAGHCWETPHPSPNVFDPIEAIESWVEHGNAPDRIDVTMGDSTGKAVRSRPLCPYPSVAKYSGVGSIDLSSSFECSQPP
jgi:hypothetical protein